MDLQKAVKEALNALYHHPDDAVRMQADRWLQEFQRTIDAWQVADNLLHDETSNLETLIFCSQTLRSKVQRDFEELPSEAFRPLRDSLNTLLKKFHRGPPRVRTQISIALAALAVHVSAEDWGDGGILNWLKEEMNSHQEYIPGFLELLTVLPEEVFNYKIAARTERRNQFEKELTSEIEVALNILTACLNLTELKEQVLEAFASWLRLRHGIPGDILASHPLVRTAVSTLNSDILSEAAVNVVSELIHYSSRGSIRGVFQHMPLIQVIVPQVMHLQPQLRDTSKDEEDVKAVARLFTDMGDSYVDLIGTGSDEAMMILNALLEIAGHPEYDIASMTFNFWHSLQVTITKRDSYASFGDEMSIEVERKRRLQVFRSSYESLVSLVRLFSEFNTHEIIKNLRTKTSKTSNILDMYLISSNGFAVADVLTDAASVLGGESTLRILFTKLVEDLSASGNGLQSEWRPAEADLYGIRAISKFVPASEADIMPQIMGFLSKLPHEPQLLQTVCLTIGAYSKWLDSSASGLSHLPSVIDIIMDGMVTTEDTAASAALALRHICDDCRLKLCGSLDGLFHIYQSTVNGSSNFKVSPEDSLHLVEALSMVISELPPDSAKKALEALCLPVVSPLQEIINQGPEAINKKVARELTVHIDRFAYIFRYVHHPEAVADAIQRLWPIFKAIFDIRPWDMRTMESLCRACKYAVRNSGRLMGVTMGAMLEEIQFLYQQHHQPCFLYLSSEVIKIFGSDQSCANYLANLIEGLFSKTTSLLPTIAEFTARPDIADDCFLLASRCIRYCPHLFIPSPVFPALVDCAMIGITVQHREASNSILSFLSDIFDMNSSKQGEKFVSIRDSVIISRGPNITRLLIASLTGALPSSRIEMVSYALLSLARACGLKAVEWANEGASLIPTTALTEVERSRFLQALYEITQGSELGNLVSPVEEMSYICRRNRTVQEIVQTALRPLEYMFPTPSS